MKKKVIVGVLVFLFFIAMVTAVIIKDAENRKAVDEITKKTINNALLNDEESDTRELQKESDGKGEQVTVLAQKTYSIGEDTFGFSFGQRGNGDYSFTLLCKIEDKADAYMTNISLNSLFNSDADEIKALTETMNFTYSIIMGDGTLLFRSKGLLYLSRDGEIIDVNDYFPVEWVLEENATKSDYGTQVTNFLADFIQNE